MLDKIGLIKILRIKQVKIDLKCEYILLPMKVVTINNHDCGMIEK